jgi:quercetin dioxygenase-like cupin family protein
VHRGRLKIESAGDAEELNPGDSASYRADVPHALINAGKSEAVVFLIVIYR